MYIETTEILHSLVTQHAFQKQNREKIDSVNQSIPNAVGEVLKFKMPTSLNSNALTNKCTVKDVI